MPDKPSSIDAVKEFQKALEELRAAERCFDTAAAEGENVICATYRFASARLQFGRMVAKIRAACSKPDPDHAFVLPWLRPRKVV